MAKPKTADTRSRSRHYMGEAYDMQVEREKARRELRENCDLWVKAAERLARGEEERHHGY